MKEWSPKLKQYPHFDCPLSQEEIFKIVSDPQRVAKNSFYPFILRNETTKKFGRSSKTRPIRYASRRDSYIFSYYRHILSYKYEELLDNLGISEYPIAYRSIKKNSHSESGKSNIDFARESFLKIKEMQNCYAIALDIGEYFESIDHQKLKEIWCRLLETENIPPDHEAVFKNITNYSVVDIDECYERLGYKIKVESKGISKYVFKLRKGDIPIKLCSNKDFREKICNSKNLYGHNIIKRNKNNYGIPQGSPISDLLANIYLIDFDLCMSNFMNKIDGYYRRYSDDIILIFKSETMDYKDVENKCKELISNTGSMINIKDNKTNITKFTTNESGVYCDTIYPNNKHKPFEYLGFSFDGNTVKIKDSTLSRYYRKMTFGIRNEASNLSKRYQNKNKKEIMDKVDMKKILPKYGRIENFDYESDYNKWNFWTYIKKSSDTMKDIDNIILKQMRNHKKKITLLLETELDKAIKKRDSNLK